MRRSAPSVLLLLVAALVLASAPTWGAETTAQGVFRRMQAAQRSIQRLHATYNMTIRMGEEGKQGFSMEAPLEFAMEKPNKVRVFSPNSFSPMTLVCDGTKLYEYNPSLKQVKITDAPKDIEHAPAEVRNKLQGLTALMGGAGQGTDKSFMAMAKTAKFFGTRKLDGAETYVVQSDLQGMFRMKLWVGARDFQIYKMEMNMDMMTMLGGMMDAMVPNSKEKTRAKEKMPKQFGIAMTLVATGMTVDQPIPPETFQFTIPEGATIVQEFTKAPATSPIP